MQIFDFYVRALGIRCSEYWGFRLKCVWEKIASLWKRWTSIKPLIRLYGYNKQDMFGGLNRKQVHTLPKRWSREPVQEPFIRRYNIHDRHQEEVIDLLGKNYWFRGQSVHVSRRVSSPLSLFISHLSRPWRALPRHKVVTKQSYESVSIPR